MVKRFSRFGSRDPVVTLVVALAVAGGLAGCGGGSTPGAAVPPPVVVNECAPMVPKAGDKVTVSTLTTYQGVDYPSDLSVEYFADTYQGKAALRMRASDTVSSGWSDSFRDPNTGALLGFPDTPSNTTLVVATSPVDYWDRILGAPLKVDETQTLKTVVRVSGRDLTDRLVPPYRDATAMLVEVTYSFTRSASESVTVSAGTFANVCRWSVSNVITNITMEGTTYVSPQPLIEWAGLAARYVGANAKDKQSYWITNKMVLPIKFFYETDSGSSLGLIRVTHQLKSYTLVAR